MNRKGISDVFSMIGTIVIVLIILVILVLLIYRGFANLNEGLNSCKAKEGECQLSCGGYEPIIAGNADCRKQLSDETAQCCRVPQTDPKEARGIGANKNFITLLVNRNQVAHGANIDADPDSEYRIDVNLLEDSKINEADAASSQMTRYCSAFVKNTLTDERFVLSKTPDDASTLIPLNEEFPNTNFLIPCNELKTFYFKPTAVQSGETYEFNTIIYEFDVTVADSKQAQEAIFATAYQTKYWVSHSAIYFKVKKVIEVVDVSSTWTATDEITVRVFEPYRLSGVSATIVRQDDLDKTSGLTAQSSIYRKLQEACEVAEDYKSSFHRITALKGGSEGYNVGLFSIKRDNPQQIGYLSQAQPITFTETQSKIYLDASTIIEDFFKSNEEKFRPLVDETLELQNYYLCVKANITKGRTGDTTPLVAFSSSPLKLDIAPPHIQNTDDFIEVIYPTPFRSQVQVLENQGIVQPGQRITPYHFQEYPRVNIKQCKDKSGCARYDYYFAPTSLEININANSIEDGIVATILGTGINYLYQYMLSRNPLDTVCPLATSNSYRRNTAPDIRFRDQQGIFCIKVIDGAGNHWLTWKPVYNPYDVFESLAAEILPNPQDIRPVVD